MAFGILTYDESGGIMFDSRRHNLFVVYSKLLQESDLGTVIELPLVQDYVAVSLEPQGSVEGFDYSQVHPGSNDLPNDTEIELIAAQNVTVDYLLGYPRLTIENNDYQGYFKPTFMTVYSYGAAV